MNKAIERFLKYFGVGFSTFLFDLFLLYIFINIFFINYVVSTGMAFLIAVSVNYYLSRTLVFHQTTRPFIEGYYWFILIAGMGAIVVMGFMFLFVSTLGWYYLPSRIIIAGIVGTLNYLLNLFFNFNVAGKH